MENVKLYPRDNKLGFYCVHTVNEMSETIRLSQNISLNSVKFYSQSVHICHMPWLLIPRGISKNNPMTG